jgi:hypothetical protein
MLRLASVLRPAWCTRAIRSTRSLSNAPRWWEERQHVYPPPQLHQHPPAACRGFSQTSPLPPASQPASTGFGLMNGTSDDKFYARELDLHGSEPLLRRQPGEFWRAAEADAAAAGVSTEVHLLQIEERREAFFKKDEVYDRAELVNIMEQLVHGKGGFMLLLGNKSVGKSLLLRQLARENKDKVVLVDARESGADVATGLVRDLSDRAGRELLVAVQTVLWTRQRDDDFGQKLLAAGRSALGALGGLGFRGIKLRDVVSLAASDPISVITAFVVAQNKRGVVPSIFIDEANLALKGDEAHLKQTLALLELFTKYTKQHHQLNVVLASSDHAEASRLKALGFGANNYTDTVFYGEVPPRIMRELLCDEWGMGPLLAAQCMAHYGGHVWNTTQAIKKLPLEKDEFRPKRALHAAIASGIQTCLKAEQRDTSGEMQGMRELLRLMAEHGFAPLKKADDPRAELLSEHYVGGVVSKYARVFGLPSEVWGSHKFGVIPASQSVRLMIAEFLCGDADEGAAKGQ